MINWIEDSDLDEAELMKSPDLAQMLGPYRLINPLPLRCPKGRCNAIIVYLALSEQQARVEFGPQVRPSKVKGIHSNKPPEEGVPRWFEPKSIISSASDLEFPDLDFQQRFAPYIEWAMDPASNVELVANPDVGAPYPLRFRFTCPECGAVYRHTNRTLLIEFLRAVSIGKRGVRPGRI